MSLCANKSSAIGQLATKLGVAPRQVRNAVIWGNHSNTMFPDATRV
jgi:malate dehydrogenase